MGTHSSLTKVREFFVHDFFSFSFIKFLVYIQLFCGKIFCYVCSRTENISPTHRYLYAEEVFIVSILQHEFSHSRCKFDFFTQVYEADRFSFQCRFICHYEYDFFAIAVFSDTSSISINIIYKSEAK